MTRFLTAALVLGVAPVALAQGFTSTSTGADGALDFSGEDPGAVVDLDPAGLDPEGDNVFHLTTVFIPADVTVRLRTPVLLDAPVYLLATGNVVIAGTLDLRGEDGHPAGDGVPRIPARGGPGGFRGGVGGISGAPSGQTGAGPEGSAYGGGGGGTNAFLMPLAGGSGGGGSYYGTQATGGAGGGGGGGALLIASDTSIDVSGAILAGGGAGGMLASEYRYGGGGGGGAVRLLAPVILGDGDIVTSGGASVYGSAQGRIRLEALDHQYTGTLTGDFRVVTLSPNVHFLPGGAVPSVRVVSVASVAVPAVPLVSFETPDVTIDSAAGVAVEIEAHNVPLGTVVHLDMLNETTGWQTVDTSALSGTLASSTATATATVAAGFNLVTVRASW